MLKLAGLAGAVGVAATGVMVARNERKRQAYTPDEVREQLHARFTRATASGKAAAPAAKPTLHERFRAWGQRRDAAGWESAQRGAHRRGHLRDLLVGHHERRRELHGPDTSCSPRDTVRAKGLDER